jgi:hypothetical protein
MSGPGVGSRLYGATGNDKPNDRLYATTERQAISLKLGAFGRKAGLPADVIERVIADAHKNILPLFDGFDLDSHQKAVITEKAVHVAIENASGRLSPELVKSWDTLVMEELRAKRIPRGRAKQILDQVGERLLAEKPEAHAALARGYPVARHPVVARRLIEWHLRREGEDATKARRAKYVHGQRDGSSLLAGSPSPSAAVASTALKSLGKAPLGSSLYG